MFRLTCAYVVLLFALLPTNAGGITIEFDYSLDGRQFFNTQERRDVLEAAADVWERIVSDELAAIEPSEDNAWRVQIPNPGTGGLSFQFNLAIPEDTIRIFVGGRDIPDDDIASVDIGILGGTGSDEWENIVLGRGQPNATGEDATDFGPWGGAMAFDTTTPFGGPRKWHFDVETLPGPDEYDFYSAAIHEIPKVLGIGTADSWDRWVDGMNHQFIGPAAVAEFGEPVPLDPSEASNPTHWSPTVLSRIYPNGEEQTALNTPTLPPGARLFPTDLDIAALRDIGWEIAPPGPVLQAGDADQDGDFDQLDLVRVQIAGKYLTGQPATWGEGDWNGAPGGSPGNAPRGDGVFDRLDIVAALQSGLYLSGQLAAIGPDRSRAGEPTAIQIDITGGELDLVNIPVPEPTTWALGVMATLITVFSGRIRFARSVDGNHSTQLSPTWSSNSARCHEQCLGFRLYISFFG